MASLSNITLSISAGSSSSTKNVTVGGTMSFDATEVGKSFRLEILVMGEDLPGDTLPSGDAVGDDKLYTFQWGSIFVKTPYKSVTVMSAGSLSFTETRVINVSTLDEDAGAVDVPSGDINTPPTHIPRKDEVYAKVSLSGSPTSANSPIVSTFGI